MGDQATDVIDLQARVKVRSLEDRNATLVADNASLREQLNEIVAASGGALGVKTTAHRPSGGVSDIDPPGVRAGGPQCGQHTAHGYCPRVEVDPVDRVVRCLDCGEKVDPIDVILDYANLDRRLLAQTQALLDKRAALVKEIHELDRKRGNAKRSLARDTKRA